MLWIAFRIQYLWYQQQQTTVFTSKGNRLWIAFRIQYLWYQQQPHSKSPSTITCCELLSEFSIFDTNNNNKHLPPSWINVVNCFQNSVSLIPTTTKKLFLHSKTPLWIAFRIQYLWYQQQQTTRKILRQLCCELLSEFSIFDTNNNYGRERK